METILQDKENEIRNLEHIMLKKKDKAAEITNANEKLRQEQSGLRTSLLEERKHIITDIKGINAAAKVAIAQLKEDLSAGIRESTAEVNKLRDQALEIGKGLGRFDETIESNQSLTTMKGLVKGDLIDPSEVRQIGIVILRGMQTCLETDNSYYGSSSLLKLKIETLIDELVRWKP